MPSRLSKKGSVELNYNIIMSGLEQGEGYLLQGILLRHTPGKTDRQHENMSWHPVMQSRFETDTSCVQMYMFGIRQFVFRSLGDLVVCTCCYYPQFWTNLQQSSPHYVLQITADTRARGIAAMLVVRSPRDTVVVRCLQPITWQHSY